MIKNCKNTEFDAASSSFRVPPDHTEQSQGNEDDSGEEESHRGLFASMLSSPRMGFDRSISLI